MRLAPRREGLARPPAIGYPSDVFMLCYRFFGVGDATIPKLNILIERNGALQGEARANGSVAIINTDKAWCIDSDGEYRFSVQVGAKGKGRYVFGVWARRPS